MLGDMFGIVTGDEEKFHISKKALFEKLTKIEAIKNQEKFFNGEEFNLIDAAFATLFMRLFKSYHHQ
jgi:glutathione S-transferase